MNHSKPIKTAFSGILAAVAYLLLSAAAWAHHPTITAEAVCADTGETVVNYTSTSWLTTGEAGSGNSQIDIDLDGVVVDSQPYVAPDYSFSGFAVSSKSGGDPVVVTATAVGDWDSGAAGGQSTSVTVTSPESCSFCGDGILDPDEQCDDGNNEDGDSCSASCTIEPFCGDYILDPGEGCDDGNNIDGDGCSASCTIESYCGDGALDAGEQCDDGNNIDGDGCDSSCVVEPFCGDGTVDPGEMCDDGNNINGDGCSAVCTIEGGGEGCTPGYWKQTHHFDSWSSYAPETLFSDVFEDAFPSMTLLQVLKQGGGGLNALGRHTVAALLDAASTGVSYDMSTGQVIDMFNETYPGTKQAYNTSKNIFEHFNEQGCPLN